MSETGVSPVEWGELPSGRRCTTDWEPIAAALRERPGQWAKVTTLATLPAARSCAHHIRLGRNSCFQHGFEAHARGCDVWARYVGDGG